MARLTKAEREAKGAAELAEFQRERAAEVRASWYRRVAVLMLKLRSEPVSVTTEEVDDVTWVKAQDCRPRDDRFWTEPTFPLDLPEDDDAWVCVLETRLEDAEEMLRDFERERVEAARKAALKKEALSKLTDEEKELLGL